MKTRTSLAALLAAVLALGGLTGPVAAQTPAPCPTGELTVAPPSAAAPTTVTVSIAPEVTIKPPAEGDPNSYHVHYFIDVPALPEGASIPVGDPQIVHSVSLTQDLGELEPGAHSVTVVLGQFNHAACALRGTVDFTVAEAAAPLPPQSGTGGMADESSSSGPLLAVAGIVSLLIVGTFARRRWSAGR